MNSRPHDDKNSPRLRSKTSGKLSLFLAVITDCCYAPSTYDHTYQTIWDPVKLFSEVSMPPGMEECASIFGGCSVRFWRTENLSWCGRITVSRRILRGGVENVWRRDRYLVLSLVTMATPSLHDP